MKYNPKISESRKLLADAIEAYLDFSQWNIREDEVRGCMERVYSFQIKSYERPIPVRLQIYTSIDIRSGEARTVGADAIRICAIRRHHNGRIMGFIKGKRVNRVGKISDIVKRLDKAVKKIQKESVARWREPVHCKSCGAPTFMSKAGRNVCLDLCWKK